jgi:predicted Fe-Mo cluster-binding NifX family protein
MSFKIAVATSDEETVDLHFGSAPAFLLWEVSDSGELLNSEKRIVKTGTEEDVPAAPREKTAGCGCGGRAGGCAVRVSPRIQKAAELLSDCEYLLAAGIGPGGENALKAQGITPFEITGGVREAIGKIAAYKERQNKPRKPRG